MITKLDPHIFDSQRIAIEVIYMNPAVGTSFKNGFGVGNDYERMFRLGVVSIRERDRFLLLDLNAAYPIVDPDYAKEYFRGLQSTSEGLPFKHEVEIPDSQFNAHYEEGTLKPIFDWIQEQGRGAWSFDHKVTTSHPLIHTFTFHFEDEMTGVWSKMAYSSADDFNTGNT